VALEGLLDLSLVEVENHNYVKQHPEIDWIVKEIEP
jgi:hypothetical protein